MSDQPFELYRMFLSKESIPDSGRALPGGFSFELYSPGSGADWAAITHDAHLFGSFDKALFEFDRSFLPHLNECGQRMWFVRDDAANRLIATATSWYGECRGKRCGMIHWVGVRREYQHRGIGSALVYRALSAMRSLEPGRDIFLDTSADNAPAIALYASLGFRNIPV